MLFLGLGTGLGTALIVDGTLEPMELAHLPYKKGRTFVGGARLWKGVTIATTNAAARFPRAGGR